MDLGGLAGDVDVVVPRVDGAAAFVGGLDKRRGHVYAGPCPGHEILQFLSLSSSDHILISQLDLHLFRDDSRLKGIDCDEQEQSGGLSILPSSGDKKLHDFLVRTGSRLGFGHEMELSREQRDGRPGC